MVEGFLWSANSATIMARVRAVQAMKEASPCTDCGKFYPYYVMDFDHTSDGKEGNVSQMVKTHTMKAILAEIGKCELVCANCHRIRTHSRSEDR